MIDSIIKGLTDYFMKCPLLKDGVFRVDALGNEAVEYTIETGVVSPVIQEYLDGSSIRQYKFTFGSREYYSLDRLENICNWIESQSKAGVLPEMPEKCEAEKLIVDAPGYMFDATMTTARYQIQLTLQYFKEV